MWSETFTFWLDDRLQPSPVWSVSSHGILWDKTREHLLLLANIGDALHLHRLRLDDLIGDPVATVASLASKVGPEVWKQPDANVVRFKH